MKSLLYVCAVLIIGTIPAFTANAEQDEWHIPVTDGGMDARITYYTTLHQNDANMVKEAVEKAWPMYKAATGVQPAAMVKIYVADVFINADNPKKRGAPDGLTGYHNGVCTIYIKPGTETHLKSTTAHELFHCWQKTMELKPFKQNKWMYEATAVWAEDWVYKTHASEHQYDQALFSTLDASLLDTGSTREYGGYVYFYKLYQQAGFSPTPVITLVKKLKTKSQGEVIKGQTGLHENIKEFAFWNWNKDPFKEYTDTPAFPNIRPSGSSIKSLGIAERGEYKAKFRTEGGGAQYVGVGFEEGIDKVVFKVSEYNSLTASHIGMQALIKINDEWPYADWSDQTETTYCRNREAEKVQVVVLIASNSDVKDSITYVTEGTETTEEYTDAGSHSGEMTIDASGECPKAWHGSVTYTNGGGGRELTIRQRLVIHEELEEVMDERGDMHFEIVKQEFDYTASHSAQSGCPYTCSGDIATVSSSYGHTSRERPEGEEYPGKRFSLEEDGTPTFIVEEQMYGDCDYVTRTQTTKYACLCAGNSSSDSSMDVDQNQCHSVEGIRALHKIPTQFSEDGTRINGRESLHSERGYFNGAIEWEYTYE